MADTLPLRGFCRSIARKLPGFINNIVVTVSFSKTTSVTSEDLTCPDEGGGGPCSKEVTTEVAGGASATFSLADALPDDLVELVIGELPEDAEGGYNPFDLYVQTTCCRDLNASASSLIGCFGVAVAWVVPDSTEDAGTGMFPGPSGTLDRSCNDSCTECGAVTDSRCTDDDTISSSPVFFTFSMLVGLMQFGEEVCRPMPPDCDPDPDNPDDPVCCDPEVRDCCPFVPACKAYIAFTLSIDNADTGYNYTALDSVASSTLHSRDEGKTFLIGEHVFTNDDYTVKIAIG